MRRLDAHADARMDGREPQVKREHRRRLAESQIRFSARCSLRRRHQRTLRQESHTISTAADGCASWSGDLQEEPHKSWAPSQNFVPASRAARADEAEAAVQLAWKLGRGSGSGGSGAGQCSG